MNKWVGFWILGIVWGSSYLLIRIGNEQVSPFQLVFIRTAIAAIGLNIVLSIRGKHLPFNPRQFLPLLILGIINTIIPFALITWGEQTVDSGVASVLNSTTAFFTLVIAHFAFADERITVRKLAGVLVGFVGVIVLASSSWAGGELQTGSLIGQLAIVLASLSYGFGSTYGRGVVKQLKDPLVVSAGAMTTAAILSGILMLITPLFGGQPITPFNELHGDALASLLILGAVNTFIAYLLYYWLIQELGASRTSMVTYVIPPVGIALGALILNEPVDSRLILGGFLILLGIAVVNLKVFGRKTAAVAVPDPSADIEAVSEPAA